MKQIDSQSHFRDVQCHLRVTWEQIINLPPPNIKNHIFDLKCIHNFWYTEYTCDNCIVSNGTAVGIDYIALLRVAYEYIA